ncbi:uncharacterized protein [Epargyreus clarus]|uniref:uncharacterized protein isoform X2 n=1 Tax=Epargyreus clarus TaxID=520877 RepID=UPI003C2B9824
MLNFNVDLAVKCIKTITDNTQCITCDKLSGRCVRFPCGHSVCECCAEEAGECLSCVSSPSGSYQVDHPQTERLKNASALLSAFQDAFEIDVHKRQRISDHLKIEKQVFPECIQAPQKYCNKRKSFNISISNKENINQTVFPGEKIISTDTTKMKKSFQYVQNWLNQNDNIPQKLPRKPFGDININTQSLTNTRKQNLVKKNRGKTEVIAKKSQYVKRTHVKSINDTSSLFNELAKEGVKIVLDLEPELNKEENKYVKSHTTHKCDRNESGIVLDDEQIVLDESQEDAIDKDKLACIAILEAAKRDDCQDSQIISQSVLQHSDNCVINFENYSNKVDISKSDSITINDSKGVLFYKKSLLYDPCKLCNDYLSKQNKSNTTEDKNKDVSIVINNSDFVTTIKFSQCVQDKQEPSLKKSVEIQTLLPQHEANSYDDKNISTQKRKIPVNDDVIPPKILRPDVAIQSLDVFPTNETKECTKLKSNDCTEALQNVCNDSLKHFKSVVIEDSDTESNLSYDNDNNMHEVVADVHRTSAPETVLENMEYLHQCQKPKIKVDLVDQ